MSMGWSYRLRAQGLFRTRRLPRPAAWRRVAGFALAGVGCALVITSCGGDSGTGPGGRRPHTVARIVFNRSVDSVEVERTSTLTVSALDSAGLPVSTAPESWAVADTSIATVSSAGVVTGVRIGQTTLTVTSGNASSQMQVVVLPPAVATITFPVTSFTMTEGDTLTLPTPTVVDRTGATVTGRTPSYSSNSANVTVNSNGRLTAVIAGSATITATIDTAHTHLTVTVAAAPIGRVSVIPAILDLGTGHTIATQSSAYAVDGTKLQGRSFQYSTDDPSVATVSASGIVTGVAPGKTTLTVTSGDGSVHAPISVAQLGVSGFLIDLRFVGDVPTSVRTAAQTAVTRWEQVISAPLIPYHVVVNAGDCGKGLPAIDTTETSMMVIIQVDSIDGYSNTVGLGGPCVIRDDSPQFTALGTLTIDKADVTSLDQEGILAATITHEIGHILGIGTLWGDPTIPAWNGLASGLGGSNPVFTGHAARVAAAALGFTSDSSLGVPIENQGTVGDGTRDSHWRASVFGHELMTGTIHDGLNPLSLVTVETLADFGYTVVPEAADDFDAANATNPGGYLKPSLRIGIPVREQLLFPKFTTTRTGRLKPIPGARPSLPQ
jgi:uncharacterized protein YjdB